MLPGERATQALSFRINIFKNIAQKDIVVINRKCRLENMDSVNVSDSLPVCMKM